MVASKLGTHDWFCRCLWFPPSRFPIYRVVFNSLVVTLPAEAALTLVSCSGSFFFPAWVDCLCDSPVGCSSVYLNPLCCVFLSRLSSYSRIFALLFGSSVRLVFILCLWISFLLLACLVAWVCLPLSVWSPVSNQIKVVAFWAWFFCLAPSLHLTCPSEEVLMDSCWWIFLI